MQLGDFVNCFEIVCVVNLTPEKEILSKHKQVKLTNQF
jgi:hypothetical protein